MRLYVAGLLSVEVSNHYWGIFPSFSQSNVARYAGDNIWSQLQTLRQGKLWCDFPIQWGQHRNRTLGITSLNKGQKNLQTQGIIERKYKLTTAFSEEQCGDNMKEQSHEIQKPRGSPTLLVGIPKRARGNPKCIPESPGKLRSSGISQEGQVKLTPSGWWPPDCRAGTCKTPDRLSLVLFIFQMWLPQKWEWELWKWTKDYANEEHQA